LQNYKKKLLSKSLKTVRGDLEEEEELWVRALQKWKE
jgi:hypothetical protein